MAKLIRAKRRGRAYIIVMKQASKPLSAEELQKLKALLSQGVRVVISTRPR